MRVLTIPWIRLKSCMNKRPIGGRAYVRNFCMADKQGYHGGERLSRTVCRFCEVWLEAYAATLTTDEEREIFSDAMLSAVDGWRDVAHSETSDTTRSRRIRRELPLDEDLAALGPQDIEVFNRRVLQLAAAGLTNMQKLAWWYVEDCDLTQAEAGRLMGEISQQAVSRLLDRARGAMRRQSSIDVQLLYEIQEIFPGWDQSNWPRLLIRLARAHPA